MKTDCNLIKDILPLYVKGETSAESNTIIEAHLNECDDCRGLKRMLSVDDFAGKTSKRDNDFARSMKKVKHRFNLRIAIAVLLSMTLVSGVFLFCFWGVVPVKSTDVEIVPEVYIAKDEAGAECYAVEFHLTLLQTGRCIDLRHGLFNDSDGSDDNYEATVYSQINLPFDDRGKNTESFDAGVLFSDLTGEEKIVFHFRDKDVEYNIKALVEEGGLIIEEAGQ